MSENNFSDGVRQTPGQAYQPINGKIELPSQVPGYKHVYAPYYDEAEEKALEHLAFCEPSMSAPATRPVDAPARQSRPQPANENTVPPVEQPEPRQRRYGLYIGMAGALLAASAVAAGSWYEFSPDEAKTLTAKADQPVATEKTARQATKTVPQPTASTAPAASFAFNRPDCPQIATYAIEASVKANILGRIYADNTPYGYPISPTADGTAAVDVCLNPKAVSIENGQATVDRSELYFKLDVGGVTYHIVNFSKKQAIDSLSKLDPQARSRDGRYAHLQNVLVNKKGNNWPSRALDMIVYGGFSHGSVVNSYETAAEAGIEAEIQKQASAQNIDPTAITTEFTADYDTSATDLTANMTRPKIDQSIMFISYKDHQFETQQTNAGDTP